MKLLKLMISLILVSIFIGLFFGSYIVNVVGLKELLNKCEIKKKWYWLPIYNKYVLGEIMEKKTSDGSIFWVFPKIYFVVYPLLFELITIKYVYTTKILNILPLLTIYCSIYLLYKYYYFSKFAHLYLAEKSMRFFGLINWYGPCLREIVKQYI